MRKWFGPTAGLIVGLGAFVAIALDAPAAVPYGAGFAGLIVMMLTWPRDDQNEWTDIAGHYNEFMAACQELGLNGTPVVSHGRLFIGMAGEPSWPPLDDGRYLYDGGDAHPVGLAIAHPGQARISEFLESSGGLPSLQQLPEHLLQWRRQSGIVESFRLLPSRAGKIHYRFAARPENADFGHAWIALAVATIKGSAVKVVTTETVDGSFEGELSTERP